MINGVNQFMFTLVIGLAVISAANSKSGPDSSPQVMGLTGKVDNIRTAVPADVKPLLLVESRIPVDVDLKRMAEWSLEYLINSPRERFNYDPVFECYPYKYPPEPNHPDPIVPCDTDARMDWEWYYMRDITGSSKGRDAEAVFHKRIKSYVKEDGIVWAPPGCYNEADIHATYEEKDYLIHMWGAPKILRSLSEDYIRTKNPESKDLARKIMLGLKRLAKWDDKGRCWIECGMGGLKADGSVAVQSVMPAPVVGPLVTYWQATGDNEALEFAKAYAEGMIAGLQPYGLKFEADGSFGDGHGHVTMRSVWGVAQLGVATGEKKYVDFARRSFDWVLSRGTGTGWFPAVPAIPFCTEVCLISDMMSTASCIAETGQPEYYDYIERSMRNYIANLQFIADREGFEARYRKEHPELSEDQIREGMAASLRFQGGFYNAGVNDFENSWLWGGYIWKISGCCAPEGIRAVYTCWQDTIRRMPKSQLGPKGIYVNMSFNRKSEWGDVTSFMPHQGRLTVKAKVRDDFFIRPPYWADRNQVLAFVDSKPVPVKWSGAYVQFDAKPGQELTLTYPLISFSQQCDDTWEKTAPGTSVTFLWLGNMVTDTLPRAKPGTTPLFTGKVKETPPVPD
ncbi:MAG: glycoside hydrolase family protein [Armatimonadota bacterium]